MKYAIRTLNAMVLLAAITAAVLGWKLFDRRNELRARGDFLAKQIHMAAIKLDEKSAIPFAQDMTIGENGEGTLGWTAFHSSPAAFEQAISRFVDQTAMVTTQRNHLAASLEAIARQFNWEDVPEQKLLNPETFPETDSLLQNRLTTFRQRDAMTRESLSELAHQLNPASQDTPDNLLDMVTAHRVLSEISTTAQNLQQKNNRYSAALTQMVTSLTSYQTVVKPVDIPEFDASTASNLVKMGQQIDQRLAELTLIKQQIARQTQKINQLERTVADHEGTIASLTATVDQKQKRNTYLENLLREKDDRQGGSLADISQRAHYEGRIIRVNYDYNYLIITWDSKRDHLLPNTPLTIARDREFIGEARVSRIEGKYAVAEILQPNKQGEAMPGDRVVLLE